MCANMEIKTFIDRIWDDEIVPTLTDYIRIPNKSPHFDPEWEAHGHIDREVALFETWARKKIDMLPGDARSRSSEGPHAADLHGNPRRGERHRPALRPSRQA